MKYIKPFQLLIFLGFVTGFSGCGTRIQPDSNSDDLYDYDVEEKIAGMDLELSVLSKPVANYVHAVRSGNLSFFKRSGCNCCNFAEFSLLNAGNNLFQPYFSGAQDPPSDFFHNIKWY